MIEILVIDAKKQDTYIKQCPDCHCIFSYQEEDLEEEYSEWFGSKEVCFINHWVACPNCAEKISIGCVRRERKKGSKLYDDD